MVYAIEQVQAVVVEFHYFTFWFLGVGSTDFGVFAEYDLRSHLCFLFYGHWFHAS